MNNKQSNNNKIILKTKKKTVYNKNNNNKNNCNNQIKLMCLCVQSAKISVYCINCQMTVLFMDNISSVAK